MPSIEALERRLTRIEAKLFPKPRRDKKPVESGASWLTVVIVAHDMTRAGESYLSGYARAAGYRDEVELFEIAHGDRELFHARHAPFEPEPRRVVSHLESVRQAVIERFIVEEIVWQVLELGERDGLLPPGPTPSLCQERPLRPV